MRRLTKDFQRIIFSGASSGCALRVQGIETDDGFPAMNIIIIFASSAPLQGCAL